jgi:hypothetical protein
VEVVDDTQDEPAELRFDAAGPGFSVWAGELRILAAAAREDRQTLTVDVDADGRCTRAVADQVVAQLERIAPPGAVLHSPNPVVRDQARRRGWTGPLRGALVRGASGGSGSGGAGRAVDHPSPTEAVVATVAELTGRNVEQHRRRPSRRWWNALRLGYGAALRLKVDAPDLTVAVPDSPDLMVESVAGAIDTIAAVRGSFGDHAGHLRLVSFDRVTHTNERPRWAGLADDTVFSIHLNDSLALGDAWVRLRRQRESAPTRRPPATAPGPFTVVDGVAAHEAWHQIEFKFRGRVADHVAFRRALGEALGWRRSSRPSRGGTATPPRPSAWPTTGSATRSRPTPPPTRSKPPPRCSSSGGAARRTPPSTASQA